MQLTDKQKDWVAKTSPKDLFHSMSLLLKDKKVSLKEISEILAYKESLTSKKELSAEEIAKEFGGKII